MLDLRVLPGSEPSATLAEQLAELNGLSEEKRTRSGVSSEQSSPCHLSYAARNVVGGGRRCQLVHQQVGALPEATPHI